MAVSRFVRVVLACVAAPLIAVSTGVGVAVAVDHPVADLAIESNPATGKVGSVVSIPLVWHNYGPGIVPTAGYFTEYRLPGGTEFWYEPPTHCKVITPGTHWRCQSVTMGYPDDNNPSGVPNDGWPSTINVRISQKCTTPGEVRVEYDNDPNLANNVAPMIVTVEGVKPGDCPTGSPSPRPSRPATPASPDAADDAPGAAAGDGPSLPLTGAPAVGLAAAGALLAFGGVGLVLAGRRRSRVFRS